MSDADDTASRLAAEFANVDLEAMKNAKSTTPDEKRKRCPECLGTIITRKTERLKGDPRRFPGKYRCDNTDCEHNFDNPVTLKQLGIDPDDLEDHQ